MDFSYSEKSTIFANTRLGFEFEFYSDMKPKSIAKAFKDLLDKNIRIGVKETSPKKDKIGYHTSFTPSDITFKLERDFSGGTKMYELITGVLNYHEAKQVLISVLKWIDEFGYTNEYSSIHLNISFDEKKDYRLAMSKLDILKFCLGYNEDLNYKYFPQRKRNIYCASIKKFYPKYNYNRAVFYDNMDGNNFNLPNDSKYYGVNFQKRTKNYLEFRYIGGKNYQKQIENILEILDYNILYLYSVLLFPQMNSDDIDTYNEMTSKYKNKLDAFVSIENFMATFPDINLLVNLKQEVGSIKIHFEEMKRVLYDLVICNGVRKAYINYDSDISKYQIRDAKITNARDIRNLDIVSSTITGHFTDCSFYDCKIKDSNLENCNLYDFSEVENSKIYDSVIKSSVELYKCFIKNHFQEIAGSLKSCIVIGSQNSVSEIANIDKKTVFVTQDDGKLGGTKK